MGFGLGVPRSRGAEGPECRATRVPKRLGTVVPGHRRTWASKRPTTSGRLCPVGRSKSIPVLVGGRTRAGRPRLADFLRCVRRWGGDQDWGGVLDRSFMGRPPGGSGGRGGGRSSSFSDARASMTSCVSRDGPRHRKMGPSDGPRIIRVEADPPAPASVVEPERLLQSFPLIFGIAPESVGCLEQMVFPGLTTPLAAVIGFPGPSDPRPIIPSDPVSPSAVRFGIICGDRPSDQAGRPVRQTERVAIIQEGEGFPGIVHEIPAAIARWRERAFGPLPSLHIGRG